MNSPKGIERIQHIRSVLHNLVLARSKTVERFAHEHNIEQSILSKFFSGRKSVSLGTFLRIVDALELDLGPMLSPETKCFHGSELPSIYDSRPSRRKRLSVLQTEVCAIEIHRDMGDLDPLVLTLSSGF